MPIEINSIHSTRRLPRLGNARAQVRSAATRARQAYHLRRIFAVALIVPLLFLTAALAYSYHSAANLIDARLASGYLTSRAGIYAAPRILRAGQNFPRERLIETLRRAGYIENAASNVWNGAFKTEGNAIEIRPRRQDAGSAPEVVQVTFNRRDQIETVIADGLFAESFALEPEVLTHDAGTKTSERGTLAYEQIPPALVQAILSIEDRRFFDHQGLDATGIGRALLSWTGWETNNEMRRQGGSTITQQLVKNTYLTPERTLRRKYNEAMLASALERRLSKQDIFALYCNEIYLGQRGTFAIHGVAQAAQVYFGKELKDLSLAEAAIIAGMIRSPNRYAPDRRPEQARARRNTVIDAMLRDDHITPEEAQSASAEPVAVAPATTDDQATAPYFIDYVNRLVETKLAAYDDLEERNLRIHTTIDLDLQGLAEASVKRELEKLEKVYQKRGVKPQAALVALDAQTGHVLAMVGGSHYGESQLNRATDARRQPGSIYKPIVYAAALESGLSPVMLSTDAPREFIYDRHAKYRPANYGNGYSMRDVTLRTGLIKSLNVVTVDAALRTGLPRVAALAERLGLQKPQPYPALALGTTEATPLEMASAYTAFANGGERARPVAITRATDSGGLSLIDEVFNERVERSIRPTTVYMITDMLTGVIEGGTARSARGLLKQGAFAGKTGTSRDGWFAGYTPRIVCVVWVGFDDNSQLGLTGAESALPIWTDFMKGVLELRPELGGAAFMQPDGITTVEIDPETGLRAAPTCPHRERVAITNSLAPGYECYVHQAPLPLLALTEEMPEDDALLLATQTSGVSSVVAAATPVPVPQLPRAPAVVRTTHAEIDTSGSQRLTNEIEIVDDSPKP